MNFGKIYSSVTKLPREESFTNPPDSVEKSNNDAARIQAVHNWKQSTVTQEFVKSTQDEISDLINKAIALAVSYPTTNNHQQIVQNLVKADTLSKLLDIHIYGNGK
jgi:hypothetical protein